MARHTLLTLGALLAACGTSGAVVAPAAPAATEASAAERPEPPADDGAARRAMLDSLLAEIRRLHVFSDTWPRERWEAEVPPIAREILGAQDREALNRGLTHLTYSLHDGHLHYQPADGNGSILTLPLNFHATDADEAPVFVVERADEGVGVAPGDRLVEYDGTPAAELLERFRYDVPTHPPAARAARLANVLQWRFSASWGSLQGTSIPLVFDRDGERVEVDLSFGPVRPPSGRPANFDDFRVGDRPTCTGVRDRDYGPYELVAVGVRVCLYRAAERPYRDFPIVRHHSFLYDQGQQGRLPDAPRLAQLDHQVVRDFLRSTRHRGVILDLRDNGGGNMPQIFLDWYGRGRYAAETTANRLVPDLDETALLAAFFDEQPAVDEYLRRVAAGEEWWLHAHACVEPGCPLSESHEPSHRVTDAPIAVLTGPGCGSACDSFSLLFSRHDMGPILGQSTAMMLTSNRYPIEVRLGEEVIGTVEVALDRTRLGDDGPWLEGRGITLDRTIVPTWPLAEYERAMIDGAIELLRAEPRGAG